MNKINQIFKMLKRGKITADQAEELVFITIEYEMSKLTNPDIKRI